MQKILNSAIALAIAVALLIGVATPAAAQSDICGGSSALVFSPTEPLPAQNPCGNNDEVVTLFEPWRAGCEGSASDPDCNVGFSQNMKYADVLTWLASNHFDRGSVWYPSGNGNTGGYISTPIPSGGDGATLNFNCTVGAQNVVAGPAIATPPCPPGTVVYALDVEHNVQRFTDWGQAEGFRNGRLGTYWIEAWPNSQEPAAPPTIKPKGFDWVTNGLWCLGALALIGLLIVGWNMWGAPLWARRRP